MDNIRRRTRPLRRNRFLTNYEFEAILTTTTDPCSFSKDAIVSMGKFCKNIVVIKICTGVFWTLTVKCWGNEFNTHLEQNLWDLQLQMVANLLPLSVALSSQSLLCCLPRSCRLRCPIFVCNCRNISFILNHFEIIWMLCATLSQWSGYSVCNANLNSIFLL